MIMIMAGIEKYQTLYFANRIDVRTMQRCGGTTMRHVWKQIHIGRAEKMSMFERKLEQDKYIVGEFGFRANSTRYTLIRDPFKRLISAAAYRGYEDINTVLENIDDYEDHHFDSLTSRLGHPSQYDEVFTLDNISSLIELLGGDPIHTNRGNYHPVTITDKAREAILKRYSDDVENGWFDYAN